MRRKIAPKIADRSEGPLLAQEGDSPIRFLRGPYKGKCLSEISKPVLKKLCAASYPHATDAVFLLEALLSKEYGRPMTAATAKAAMQEEWEAMKAKTKARMAELDQQPSLSERLLADLADRLREAAHEADNWPLSPPDVG